MTSSKLNDRESYTWIALTRKNERQTDSVHIHTREHKTPPKAYHNNQNHYRTHNRYFIHTNMLCEGQKCMWCVWVSHTWKMLFDSLQLFTYTSCKTIQCQCVRGTIRAACSRDMTWRHVLLIIILEARRETNTGIQTIPLFRNHCLQILLTFSLWSQCWWYVRKTR